MALSPFCAGDNSLQMLKDDLIITVLLEYNMEAKTNVTC